MLHTTWGISELSRGVGGGSSYLINSMTENIKGFENMIFFFTTVHLETGNQPTTNSKYSANNSLSLQSVSQFLSLCGFTCGELTIWGVLAT